jgi:hypothetical protein
LTNEARMTVVIAATICILTLTIFSIRHKETSDASTAFETKVKNIVLSGGAYTASDLNQFRGGHMYNSAPTGTLSDADFAWLMRHINRNTAPPTSLRTAVVEDAIDKLDDATLTPAQLHEAQTEVLPLLSEEDKIIPSVEPISVGSTEEFACEFFDHHPNKMAIPQLLVLLNSPHPYVRWLSAYAIDKLGYNVFIPPRPRSPF